MTRAKTYADHLTTGGPPELRRIDNKRSRCECGAPAANYSILDVRDNDRGEAAGQAWACAGCWTKWVRDDKSPLTRQNLAEKAGASASVVQSIIIERSK